MNYELARKLKDAGFPQGTKFEQVIPILDMGEDGLYRNDVYVPTLSELIEACGDGFCSLEKIDALDGIWLCCGFIRVDKPEDKMEFLGDTPEEAVSNLWLKLNKSK